MLRTGLGGAAPIDECRNDHRATVTNDSEIVPWCHANGVSFVAFSPLGRGFLTGALRAPGELRQGDFRRLLPRFSDGALQANLAIVTGAVPQLADLTPLLR